MGALIDDAVAGPALQLPPAEPYTGGFQVRRIGRVDYEPTWRAMQAFTAERDRDTSDEIWLGEHHPVYTYGLAGRQEHLPADTSIPLYHIDRGGQVTYHGPGQVMAYLLLDLRRRGYGVRELVRRMEASVVALLGELGIDAYARPDAPGVYVAEAKVASLGLKIRNGCSYHGLSLNVDMDLSPFLAIDPCGYRGLQVTQLQTLGVPLTPDDAASRLLPHLAAQLSAPPAERRGSETEAQN